ncbi:hypothetical protein Tco_0796433 [Tanacetum coccineum]
MVNVDTKEASDVVVHSGDDYIPTSGIFGFMMKFAYTTLLFLSSSTRDPYEEAARQLLEQEPRPSEYVPDLMELEDHVPVYIPEPEHPEDLVPAEDEAPIEASY